MNAKQWTAWNEHQSCSADAAARIGDIIFDLARREAEISRPERWYSEEAMAAVVKERDKYYAEWCQWRGAVDVSEHEGMRWKDRAVEAERALAEREPERNAFVAGCEFVDTQGEVYPAGEYETEAARRYPEPDAPAQSGAPTTTEWVCKECGWTPTETQYKNLQQSDVPGRRIHFNGHKWCGPVVVRIGGKA